MDMGRKLSLRAPLYLRDLNLTMRQMYLRMWTENNLYTFQRKKKKLLKAWKDGKDIIIGEFFDEGKEEVG